MCQESWGWGLVEGAIFEVLNTRRRDTCSYLAWVSTFSTFHRQRHRAAAGPPVGRFFRVMIFLFLFLGRFTDTELRVGGLFVGKNFEIRQNACWGQLHLKPSAPHLSTTTAEPWSDSLTANPGQRLTVPDSLTALTALSLTA